MPMQYNGCARRVLPSPNHRKRRARPTLESPFTAPPLPQFHRLRLSLRSKTRILLFLTGFKVRFFDRLIIYHLLRVVKGEEKIFRRNLRSSTIIQVCKISSRNLSSSLRLGGEKIFRRNLCSSTRRRSYLRRAWSKTEIYTKIYRRQYLRSRERYIIASAICSSVICSTPSKSAMVLATLRTLS